MKKHFLITCFIFSSALLFAQTKFITSGKIEFERKTNVYRLYFSDMENNSFMEMIKKNTPQFKIDYFDLIFTEEKSLYRPGRDADVPKKSSFFGSSTATDNVVYKDLKNETSTSNKQVYESKFLLTDSLRRIDWKMLDETRTIAGFECRKAVGRICDSVVIVAFYTDEIIPSSGPESFSGLPGMILEIAIPRLYTTWVATKLQLIEPSDEKNIVAPTKGKKANQKQMMETLDAAIKDWGEKYRDRAVWLSTL